MCCKFYPGVDIKKFVKVILLNTKKTKLPFVLRMNGFTLSLMIITGLSMLVTVGMGVYYSFLIFTKQTAFREETTKNKELVSTLDSLYSIVETETLFCENISNLETKLSLSQGISPLPSDIKKLSVGGQYLTFDEKAKQLFGSPLEAQVSTIEEKISDNHRRYEFLKKRMERLEKESKRQNDYFSEKPSIYPVRGRITSKFGYRPHPFLVGTLFHEGIDIAAPTWTPVKSPADGICTFSGVRGGYGITVELTHKRTGYVTRYAHLADAKVKLGQQITRGEIIAFVGNSGRSTGPHLHYEVKKDNKPINPMNYILCEESTNFIVD
jgi:murein DD-endopeptidase MepM/ murein hydrolase activator NlpD